MTKKGIMSLIISLLIIMLGAGSVAFGKTYEINLGHAVEPSENYAHLSCVRFKEFVEKYTDGNVKVNIYPAGQLGDEQELVRSIQMGTVQAAFPAVNNFGVYASSIGYYTLPYMFESVEQFRKITDAMWDLNNMWAIKEAGCRLLIIAEVNFRQLTNSKRPVKTLADLKGLRVRVPRNKLMINAFKGFGVEPVAMAWAEVFTALQQGVLDGQDVSFNIVRSQKFYETQKYATQIGYIAHAGCLVIGEKFFQSLPPEYRQAVVRAGKEAMDWEREYSDKMFEDDVKFLESKGMVMAGQPSDLSEWVKGARKSWPDAYEIIGGGDAKRGQAIVELVGQMKSVLP